MCVLARLCCFALLRTNHEQFNATLENEEFEPGQFRRFEEAENSSKKRSGGAPVGGRFKLMKGTPTLAPMTPAHKEEDFNDI
eukprot:symbB.v1.2.002355.t1/scaffold110.1/size325157/2